MLSNKQIDLLAWTKQKWRTKSGKKSSITGERYLPEKAINILSSAEYRLTSKLKKKTTNKDIEKIIEDLNKNFPENLLYTVLNIVEQENKYLLITSLEPLNKFNFKLPDLISRIRNCLII